MTFENYAPVVYSDKIDKNTKAIMKCFKLKGKDILVYHF